MYLTTDDAWQVDWPDPAMAALSWTWDAQHCPSPFSVLAAEVGDLWYETAFWDRPVTINGYLYLGRDPDVARDLPSSSGSAAEATATWEAERLPLIEATVAEIRGGDWASLNAGVLLAELPGMIRRSGDGFGLTIKSSSDLVPSLTALLTFCGTHFGRNGPLLGMRMLQGHANASTDSALGLRQLAAQAAQSEELRRPSRRGAWRGSRRSRAVRSSRASSPPTWTCTAGGCRAGSNCSGRPGPRILRSRCA
jgi:hypothetical protein